MKSLKTVLHYSTRYGDISKGKVINEVFEGLWVRRDKNSDESNCSSPNKIDEINGCWKSFSLYVGVIFQRRFRKIHRPKLFMSWKEQSKLFSAKEVYSIWCRLGNEIAQDRLCKQWLPIPMWFEYFSRNKDFGSKPVLNVNLVAQIQDILRRGKVLRI